MNQCINTVPPEHLSVEAFSILGDSVKLRKSKHVLLAAWPVKYPQCEWRQCSKNHIIEAYTPALKQDLAREPINKGKPELGQKERDTRGFVLY